MGQFVLRRLGVAMLQALCFSLMIFFLAHQTVDLDDMARGQIGPDRTDAEVDAWLTQRGYREPLPARYGAWLGLLPGHRGTTEADRTVGRCIDAGVHPDDAPTRCGLLQGDLGNSTMFDESVRAVLGKGLSESGRFWVWAVLGLVPVALALRWSARQREQHLQAERLFAGHPIHPGMGPADRAVWLAPGSWILRQAPWIVSAMVALEVLVGHPGVGSILVQSARAQDPELLMGAAMALILLVLAARLLADLAEAARFPPLRRA